MPPNTIVSVETQLLELELTEPFGISGGSQEVARLVVVQLTLGDGTLGLGEAAPLPAYNGESIEDVSRAIAAARPFLIGADARAWRQRALELRAPTCASAAARCALETALLDALARRAGLSLHAWFGGCTPARLVTDVTIPIVTPAGAYAAAERWWARGFRSLKIKLGGQGDVDRVLAAHAGAPDAQLLVDANGGLSATRAIDLVDTLAQHGVEVALFEQPVPASDWEGLARVGERARIALDESVVSARDALEAVRRLGAPHVINVKLMKSGIAEALDIVATARAGGMSLMIGGMLESMLAMSTSACFAAGQGGFEFVDLDTPLFLLGSPFVGGFTLRGHELDLSSIELGHGVQLKRVP